MSYVRRLYFQATGHDQTTNFIKRCAWLRFGHCFFFYSILLFDRFKDPQDVFLGVKLSLFMMSWEDLLPSKIRRSKENGTD